MTACPRLRDPQAAPVLAWLLWKRPGDSRWFGAIAVAHGVVVLGSGYADEWLARLLETAPDEIQQAWNIWPSHAIGIAWWPIGLALAALLTWKGWLGVASLLASPYTLSIYFVMLLLDAPRLWHLLAGSAAGDALHDAPRAREHDTTAPA